MKRKTLAAIKENTLQIYLARSAEKESLFSKLEEEQLKYVFNTDRQAELCKHKSFHVFAHPMQRQFWIFWRNGRRPVSAENANAKRLNDCKRLQNGVYFKGFFDVKWIIGKNWFINIRGAVLFRSRIVCPNQRMLFYLYPNCPSGSNLKVGKQLINYWEQVFFFLGLSIRIKILKM